MHVHIVQDLVTNVFVDFPQHLGIFWGEMWFIDWFIDCSCVEHSNLYVKADNYKEAFDEYSKRRVYECPPDYGPKSNADHAADLVVKLDSVYEKFTVKELKV